MTTRVPALLVTHADLGAALLRAAGRVYGAVDDVGVLSNEGLSRDQLESQIASAVASWTHGGLILTDFWGGSCHICGVAATRDQGHIVVVTGLNLPLLLDYLHNRESHEAEALAERLTQKGRESIRVHHGHPA
jgi:PTS system mannose-specific IIA component